MGESPIVTVFVLAVYLVSKLLGSFILGQGARSGA